MKKFEITNDGNSRMVATIRGEIGWDVSAEEFRKAIPEDGGGTLEVRIDSCGGDVVEAIGIFNAIRAFKGETVAVIEGVAMSAASYIMLACKTVRAFENSVVMIHNVSCGTYGNADDLEHAAGICRKFESVLLGEYARRTGRSEEEIQALLDAETYMTAAEAKELGLVDEVIGGGAENAGALKFAAMGRMEAFRRFSGNRGAKKGKVKGVNNMEIKTIEELVSALAAFAEKVADESLKAEIEEIAEAAKGLIPSEPPTGAGEGEGEKKEAAEAKRRKDIAAFAKETGGGLLDALTIDALAGDMDVAEYKGRACKILSDALKKSGKSSLVINAQMKGGEPKAKSVAEEYRDICASGDVAKRREFFKAHKAELIYK